MHMCFMFPSMNLRFYGKVQRPYRTAYMFCDALVSFHVPSLYTIRFLYGVCFALGRR